MGKVANINVCLDKYTEALLTVTKLKITNISIKKTMD